MFEYRNNIYLEEKLNTTMIGLTIPEGDMEGVYITLTSNFEPVDLTNKVVMCYITNKLYVGTENPGTISMGAVVENVMEGKVSVNIGEIITTEVGDYALEVVMSDEISQQITTFPVALIRVSQVTRQL